MRPHRRQLRHFVWVALFAWVFALAAGVAHACVVALPASAPAGHENHRHVHESVDHGLAPAALADHAGGHKSEHKSEHTSGHPDQSQIDPAKTSCLKFCDDEASALSKSGSPWFDLAAADVLMGGLSIRLAPLADALDRRSLANHRAHGPPLVIRLLRLTL